MKPRNKGVSETPPVTFEAIMGREGSGGFFGIEDEADDLARQAKLRRMAERITAYNRGYEGSRRPCPKCGQRQQYKGDRPHVLEIESGTLTIQRAYYVCPACRTTSYPLDEQLGLVEGKEQGRLREKLALLAVVTPYHQAPQVCETLFGQARPALSVRRLALREAHQLATSEYRQTLPQRPHDRVYLQVDGHMCPTRDGRTGGGGARLPGSQGGPRVFCCRCGRGQQRAP